MEFYGVTDTLLIYKSISDEKICGFCKLSQVSALTVGSIVKILSSRPPAEISSFLEQYITLPCTEHKISITTVGEPPKKRKKIEPKENKTNETVAKIAVAIPKVIEKLEEKGDCEAKKKQREDAKLKRLEKKKAKEAEERKKLEKEMKKERDSSDEEFKTEEVEEAESDSGDSKKDIFMGTTVTATSGPPTDEPSVMFNVDGNFA